MDQTDDPHELERKIERASRLALLGVSDQTTYQWLKQFAEELRQRLRHLLSARRAKEMVRARRPGAVGDQRPNRPAAI